MSSVLTYDVVGDLHHVAYDVACDVSFDSNSGVQMACTGPEYSALHLQALFLLVHWQCPPASAPTATRVNGYARLPHPAQACWPHSTASRPALSIFLRFTGLQPDAACCKLWHAVPLHGRPPLLRGRRHCCAAGSGCARQGMLHCPPLKYLK